MNPTQKLKPEYYELIEDQLNDIFFKILFEPISTILDEATKQMGLSKIENAKEGDVLLEAIRSGKIQYSDGVFSGVFSAKIGVALRRLGAKFKVSQKIYTIEKSQAPNWIKAEAGLYKIYAKEAHAEIKSALEEMQKHLPAFVEKYKVDAKPMVESICSDFEGVAKTISVNPVLPEDQKQKLAQDYNDNMELWIKNFSEDTIAELRSIVEDNATSGYRFDKLIDQINQKYGVSLNKASFLARQETSLFMSKFHQQRYGEAGITRYVWSASMDERTRDTHKHLNGKIFSWDNPPIVSAPGELERRANAGEDFNCRCTARPLLDPIKL